MYTGSGIFVGLLGVAYFSEIHHIAYFIVIQIFVGIFEVSYMYDIAGKFGGELNLAV